MDTTDECSTIVNNELELQHYWSSKNVQNTYMFELNKTAERKYVYDGPPFATGMPHYGHFLAGSLKDTAIRNFTLNGFFVDKQAGWDCVAEGTMINLSDGTVMPIENVRYYFENKISLSVETYDAEVNKIKSNNVSCFMNKGMRECIELLFDNGSTLICTPEHEILTTKKYVNAIDLTKNMNIICCDESQKKNNNIHTNKYEFGKASTTKLVSKTNVGIRYVYDITVDKTHNFVANGIVVHNCHGVPIEMKANKELGISTKDDIENKIGIDAYCNHCEKSVLTCSNDWKSIMTRFGRWSDFDNPYTTMSFDYCKKVWDVFAILSEQQLLEKGYRVSAYSCGLETSLSNFESNLNYKNRNDNSITIKLKILNFPLKQNDCEYYISIFTTTPWSLFGNCAIAINKNYEYELIKQKNNSYTITLAKEKSPTTFSGETLIGLSYEPLFDCFSKKSDSKFYKIWHGDFVDQTGTGAVHCAPMFGKEDFELCCANEIIKQDGTNLFDYIDSTGNIVQSVGTIIDSEYKQMSCFQFSKSVINFIKTNKHNNFVSEKQINHSYPHCWRTDTPLIYKALPSWMVKVKNIREELMQLNKTVNWIPESVGFQRFHSWLKSAENWNVSRSRYWGIPLPVWKQIDGDDVIIIKSVEHLEQLTGKTFTNIHRNYIDNVLIEHNGNTYKRINDVFDCWFESGCVPFYKSPSNTYQPADFIAEGLDQTRGWFYTTLIIGYACSKKFLSDPLAAYKNVMVNGLVLAKDGKKMSKSANNYTDPMLIINQYGSDALRLYLLSSPASHAEDLKFDDSGVKAIMKDILIPLHSARQFYETYKYYHQMKSNNSIVFENMAFPKIKDIKHSLNIWISCKMFELEKYVHNCYKTFQYYSAINSIRIFIENFTNDYVKLIRSVVKNQDQNEIIMPNTIESLLTMRSILFRLSIIMASIAPHFSEYLFQNAKPYDVNGHKLSIHHYTYEQLYSYVFENGDDGKESYDILCKKYKCVCDEFELLNHIRELRASKNYPKTKILKSAKYFTNDFQKISDFFLEEMNICQVDILPLDMSTIKLIPIPSDKHIGKTFGQNAKTVKNIISIFTNKDIELLKSNGSLKINDYNILPEHIANYKYYIDNVSDFPEHIICTVGHNYILHVDTSTDQTILDKIKIQQYARTFQNMRKEAKLKPWNPIKLCIETTNIDVLKTLFSDCAKETFFVVTHRELFINIEKRKIVLHKKLEDADLYLLEDETIN